MKRTGRFPRDKRAFRTKLNDALRVSGYEQANVSDVEFDFLWEYVTAPKLTQLSTRYVHRRASILDPAVSGVQSAIKFFCEFDTMPDAQHRRVPCKPDHVEALGRALVDLHAAQKQIKLPSRPRGQGRDWQAVELMQEWLKLPAERASALVNAADAAAGVDRETTPQDLKRRLEELQKRVS